MKKRVNIYGSSPALFGFGVPKVGNMRDIEVPVDFIRKALHAHARVDEILEDGRIVPLDFTNYYTDNSGSVEKIEQEAPASVIPDQVAAPTETIEEAQDAMMKAAEEMIAADEEDPVEDGSDVAEELPVKEEEEVAPEAEETVEEESAPVSNKKKKKNR